MPASDAKKTYRGVAKAIGRYWAVYGGRSAVLRSPFFHVSFVLLLLTANTWLYTKWWEDVASVVPNLLGFTLGGFAIFLGFGDEKFKSEIAGNDPFEESDDSPYLVVSSTFLHFVFVQMIALLWALAAKGLHFDLPVPEIAYPVKIIGLFGSAVGYWLFLYGICLAAAAGLAIFRVAGWYDRFQTVERRKKTDVNVK